MLRSDWVVTTVDKLGEVVSGGTPSTKVGEFWGGDIVWITPADLSDFTGKRISRGARTITKKGLANSSARLMPPGTIVFSSRAPIGYVAIADVELCTNQGFKSLIPANGVNSDYLYYYFRYIKNLAENRASGTTFKELSMKAFASLPVVVAPSVEQRAIVAKIEALFSELDKSVELLKTVKKQLKQYRQAVLKAAFEGKLTAEWRSKQQAAGRLPSADEVLEQIKKEQEERYQRELQEWEQAVAEWEAAGGIRSGQKKPRKPCKHESIPPLTAHELSALDSLPWGWLWVRIGQVFRVAVGSTPSRKRLDYWGGNIPWVTSGEVAFCEITDTREKITELGLNSISAEVHPPGSVVIAMIGEGKTRGQAAILRIAASHNQNTAVIRVSDTSCHPEMLYYFLMLSYEYNRRLGSGNNQKALNKRRVQELVFPLCSPEEQRQMVAEIEYRFSMVDELEKAVDHGLQKAEALRQSILKKAFEGRLLSEAELAAVRNDPDYEPADKLLERIRAERERNVQPSRGRRTRTTAQPNSRRRSEKSAEETVNSGR